MHAVLRWPHLGTICYDMSVVMPLVPSQMEDPMCWEVDYKFFAEDIWRPPTNSSAVQVA
jgi:hypothetical protein